MRCGQQLTIKFSIWCKLVVQTTSAAKSFIKFIMLFKTEVYNNCMHWLKLENHRVLTWYNFKLKERLIGQLGDISVTMAWRFYYFPMLSLFRIVRQRSGAVSIQPKIPKILVGSTNGTDHFGLGRPEYSGPALKVIHTDRSGHFGRSDRNVPFRLPKLLSPVPLFCILLTRTSSFQWKVKYCE